MTEALDRKLDEHIRLTLAVSVGLLGRKLDEHIRARTPQRTSTVKERVRLFDSNGDIPRAGTAEADLDATPVKHGKGRLQPATANLRATLPEAPEPPFGDPAAGASGARARLASAAADRG